MARQLSLTWRKLLQAQSHKLRLPDWLLYHPSHRRPFTSSRGLLRQAGKKPSFIPSPQQLKIANLCAVQNVVVSARPGSGKTATVEAIAAAHPDKRICVVTFSKRLQLETSARLKEYTNCAVFTFHGLAGHLFGIVISNDQELGEQKVKIESKNKIPQWSSTPFDIVVLDEFQDCTPLTFWLIACFLRANNVKKGGQPARIVVLGDERQSIYRFRGADHRYLTLAPELLGPISTYPFSDVQLGESFRLSQSSVKFINQSFLGGEEYITSSKHGPKPIVLKCDPWDSTALAKELKPLIDRYGPENCAIIAPSIRTTGRLERPVQALTNKLAQQHGVPFYAPTDDEAPLDDKVIYGKMCVSTIHQFKGRERDLIVLFDLDSSFFEFFGRDLPDSKCPNEVFVALTRALQQLVLIHNHKKGLMPFVSAHALYDTGEVINMTYDQARIASPSTPGRPLELGLILQTSTPVRDLTRYLQTEPLHRIVKRYLRVQQLSSPLPPQEHIKMMNVVSSNRERGYYESVSDINGLVVVAALELKIAGTLKSLGISQSDIGKRLPAQSKRLPSWLCRHACAYEAYLSGYLPRSIQMAHHKFNWIQTQDLDRAQRRLYDQLADSTTNLKFDVQLERQLSIEDQKTRLIGRADIITTSTLDRNEDEVLETVWEIKFVSQLSDEHIVQACMYAYLLASETGKLPRIILYNVRDGDKREITPRDGFDDLQRLITSVLRLKYTSTEKIQDEQFIKLCAETTQKVMGLDSDLDHVM
ncbi:hypothetical protein F66182_3654 [Fusarium sp. NRRL 66182]|nr:hypothetical protein F66182_3654 [Fusarium sp. NRRL 66182]